MLMMISCILFAISPMLLLVCIVMVVGMAALYVARKL